MPTTQLICTTVMSLVRCLATVATLEGKLTAQHKQRKTSPGHVDCNMLAPYCMNNLHLVLTFS